jgi:hypothetical protein
VAHHRTLLQMRTQVRYNVDEATESFFDDDALNAYLNRAKDRVATEVRKLKDDFFMVSRLSTDGSLTILSESYSASSFAIVAGTSTYTLPPDLLEIKLIEVVTSGYEYVQFVHRDLAHPDMRAAMSITDNVAPSVIYWDIYGERTLRIAPKSDTALDLRLTYVQQFADLSADGDELTMPYPLYMAVEEYATASAMAQDRNPDAAVHESRAKQIISDFFGAHARQTQDIETSISFGGWA